MLWEIDIYPAPASLTAGPARGRRRGGTGICRGLQVTAARGFLMKGHQPTTSRTIGAGILRRSRRRTDRRRAGRRRCMLTIARRKCEARARAAQAGRDGPRRAEHAQRRSPISRSRPTRCARCGNTGSADCRTTSCDSSASKVLANDAIEQVVVGPLPFERLGSWARSTVSSCVTRAAARAGRRSACETQPRRAALSVAGRDADDSGAFPRAGPRSDRRRAGNARPDLERALQPQDAGRPHRLSRRPTGERRFENMLKETIFAATQEIRQQLGDDDWCVSVFKDNAGVVRFDDEYNVVLQGRNAQSSVGLGALRRREHRRRRRDSRPARHGPGRQADLQHRRVLLRSARYAGRLRCRRACCIRGA